MGDSHAGQGLARPACSLSPLSHLSVQATQSIPHKTRQNTLTEAIARDVFLTYCDSHLYCFSFVKIQSEALTSYRKSLTDDQSERLNV